MAESIASGEIAFVGTLTGRSGSMSDGYDWRFSVSETLRGKVPAELDAHGGDFCGPDYGSIRGPLVVIVDREDDGGYVAPDCVPVASAEDLDELLAPLPVPHGRGPVAALVADPYRWSNVAALDHSGRVLSWGYVDGGVAAVTHCGNSSTAAVTTWADGGRQRLRFLDLTTMQVTDGGEIAAAVDIRGDLVCVATPRGFEVVAAADPVSEDLGKVRVAASGSMQASVSVSAASDAVVLSDGTVYVLPGRVGGSITKILDIYGTDGTLVSRSDIGWGWGDAVLGGKLLRSRDGGLELIARDGTSTPLDPPPAKDTGFELPAFVVAVEDGPVIEPRRPSPPRPNPVASATPRRATDADSAGPPLPETAGSVSSAGATTTVGILVMVAAAALAASLFVRR